MENRKLKSYLGEHYACVYKLTFPDGKVYVGKSKDIGKRVDMYERKADGSWADSSTGTILYDAMRRYGMERVLCEVLFMVRGVGGVDSERDLDYALGIVEMRWIKELKSNEREYGYNSTEGGEMFGVKRMERVKEVEVIKERVVYKDVEVQRERRTMGVPVVGYDINGDYIGEWPSRTAFTREVVGGINSMYYGVWRKGFIMYEKKEPVLEKVESYAEYLRRVKAAGMLARSTEKEEVGKIMAERPVKLERAVVMCGMDRKELRRFCNLRDTANATGLRYSSIYAVLKRGRGSVDGFHFYWADEYDACGGNPTEVIVERKKSIRKSMLGRVIQLDLNYNQVKIWEDIRAASEGTGNSWSCIYAAAKKGGKALAGGFHWRFEDVDYSVTAETNKRDDLSDVQF